MGHFLTLADCTNVQNWGIYQITAYISATTIQYTNANAINETDVMSWSIDDQDRDSKITKCRSTNARGNTTLSSDCVIDSCTFELPYTPDFCGHAQSYTISGTTVTLFDNAAPFLPSMVGKYITLAGSTSGANNGLYQITNYINAQKVTYTNAGGVTEAIPQAASWWVQGGTKTGIGSGVGAFSVAAGVTTFVVAAPISRPTTSIRS